MSKTTINDLDKIYNLGFIITIDWNMCFTVTWPSYNSNQNFGYECNVLVCQFDDTVPNIQFLEVVDYCCDIFYEWYNENFKKLDDLRSPEEFDDISLGNITKRVRRDLKLDKLL